MGLYNVSVGGAIDIVYDFADGQLPSGWTLSGDDIVVNADGIHSKNYPNDYPNDANSTLVIAAANQDSILTFDIADYELEQYYDFLEIRDGASSSDALIIKLEGTSTTPTTITTTGNRCYLKFVSDYITNKKGFRIPSVTEKTTNTSCELIQTGEDGIAVSLPYTRSEPTSEVNNFSMNLNLANIALATSTADTLMTNHKFEAGYKFVIVLDDDSVVTLDATAASSGTQPYQIDTASVTNGEIPSRVFLAEEQLAINYNYVPHLNTTYNAIDPATGKLSCVKTFGSLNIVATDLITKIDFHSVGNEMVSLTYDMIKD